MKAFAPNPILALALGILVLAGCRRGDAARVEDALRNYTDALAAGDTARVCAARPPGAACALPRSVGRLFLVPTEVSDVRIVGDRASAS